MVEAILIKLKKHAILMLNIKNKESMIQKFSKAVYNKSYMNKNQVMAGFEYWLSKMQHHF